MLALHAREVISAERLADAVWDGEPPASVDTTLRGYVSNLRKALEPDRDAKDAPRVLRTTQTGYVLDVEDEHIDSRRFERLVAAGRDRRRSADTEAAARDLSEALGLWRGDAYQDFAYSDFASGEAARLTELRLACTEDLFDARLDLGQHHSVVGDLEAFCASQPGRERALALLMLALYRCGRQADALRAYEDGRRRLADELGVDPSPELRTMHERILRHDAALASAEARAVPAGKQTLTFLLGDVERSTAKLRALGGDYPVALEEHRRIVREAFERHGRAVLLTTGEEIFAAFDGATDAVSAARDAQLALCAAGFGEERTLPVRMGLHTGEATFTGGEYVGLAIHVCARVMSTAHGGQVLVSQATKELVGAEEGADAGFLDTGLHTLKDVPEPMRLFQLTHPELRRDFPPLPTLAEASHNIPQRPTSFVGRERDLEEIGDALATNRVVTLTGVGGVGKTRLAQEAGRRLATRYPDGVWFCELAPVVDGERLVHSVATTLKVEPQPGKSMRECLLTALRQRETLVIMDNCEHLLDPVAELVEDIVAECPSADIVATSREAIGVEGERSRPVRSLKASADDPTTDAIRLFADRARDARPDFIVDERNASDVAGICARLDGIPLAIELAAARVTSLSPAQISKRLEEGFHFLRSGRRAAVDRHRTLHGAIDWSYGMLTDAERLLFDRLSVFAGGFTLEAAEQVCGSGLDIDVADGLASLVAKSMATADVGGEEARYVMLETMRQYAADRLGERVDAETVLREHAAYYMRMMEEADGFTGDSEGLARKLRLELDNLRAAHAWTTTAGDVDLALRLPTASAYVMRARPELYRWAEVVATMPGAENHPLFPIILGMSALRLLQRGARDESEEMIDRALGMIDDPDDPRRLRLIIAAGGASGRFFEGDDLRSNIDEFLRLARLHDDSEAEAGGLALQCLVGAYQGRHDEAVAAGEAAYALVRDRSTAAQAWALYSLGEALKESGNLERALDCLERSVIYSRGNDMPFQLGVALVSVATIRGELGDPAGALRIYREVIDYWRVAGTWVQQWVTLRNLAELFGRIGEDEHAAVLLAASESSRTAVPVFGAQAERLDALRSELAQGMGADAFAAATERGRATTDEEAVAYAKSQIDSALEQVRVQA